MSPIIAPSILASNFLHLENDLQLVNESVADWLHVDIMDGNFVPNISFGPDIVSSMKKVCTKFFDLHLMIQNPDQYIDIFKKAGADQISVHYEACPHLHATIQKIKNTGVKAGVAINPHTPIESLSDILEDLDLVILMSVNPGFGGQKFIPSTLKKIEKLKSLIITGNYNTLIEIDGGVGLQNAESILSAGADVLVAGSSVFHASNPSLAIYTLKNLDARGAYVSLQS